MEKSLEYEKLCDKIVEMREKCIGIYDKWYEIEKLRFQELKKKESKTIYDMLVCIEKMLKSDDKSKDIMFNNMLNMTFFVIKIK